MADNDKSVTTKKKILRSVLTVATVFIVLLVLAVGGIFAYAFFGAKEVPAATVADPKSKNQLQESVKPRLDPNSPVGVSVQSLTTPASPGQNVLMIAKTKPEAICTIVVEYDGKKSTDSGLGEKTADEYGVAQWSWAVEPTAPVGKWPITVTCTLNGKSGVLLKEIEITASR